MQNKKLYLIIVVVVLVIGAAAFIGGRFLTGQAGLMPNFLTGENPGGMTSVAINMNPAPELPTTNPETFALFISRNDNSITVQPLSMNAGPGGVIAPPSESASEPKVEVVITNETKIYRDATDLGTTPPKEGQTVQQVVEPGSLDELTSQTTVVVWGRKNGDRIIADVIAFYSPVVIQQPQQ